MFFAGFAGKFTPLLLLDYDGTLAPFCVDRFLARPWAGVRELLTRIQQQGRTRMAIISGRSVHEIRPLLGIDPPFEVWGLHGAERLFPNG
jgi:trehalose 6-phosphate synthase/trehalose 6-phosphate phosphatase